MTENTGTWFDTVFRPEVERHKDRLRVKNVWLTPIKPDPKTRPTIGFGRIPRTDAVGLREEIAFITQDVIDGHTGLVKQYGRLRYRTMKVKEKRANIERRANAQANLRGKKVHPTGRDLEELAELTARQELEEETSRLLHKMLKEKEAEEKATEIGRRSKVGSVKLKDGQPFTVDGRELVETNNGEFMLADSGVLLKDYLAEAVASRGKRFARTAGTEAAHDCASCE